MLRNSLTRITIHGTECFTAFYRWISKIDHAEHPFQDHTIALQTYKKTRSK